MHVRRFDQQLKRPCLSFPSCICEKILLLLTRVREIYAGLLFTHWYANIYGRSRLECITFHFKNRIRVRFVSVLRVLTITPATTAHSIELRTTL